LEKTKDTAITTVDVGPWMYTHREAGKWISDWGSESAETEYSVVKPMLDTFVKGIRDDPKT